MFVRLFSVYTIVSFGASLTSNYKEPIKCVSLNNQTYKTRQKIVNINSDEALFYPFTVSVKKCD